MELGLKSLSGSHGWQNVSAIDMVSGTLITIHIVWSVDSGRWVSAFLWGWMVVIHSNQQQSTTDAFDMQRNCVVYLSIYDPLACKIRSWRIRDLLYYNRQRVNYMVSWSHRYRMNLSRSTLLTVSTLADPNNRNAKLVKLPTRHSFFAFP